MKSFQIPSVSLSLFDTVSVILWIPIYDRTIVPLARNYFTGRQNSFTQLQRIAIGLVISIFAMLAARTLEMVGLREVRRNSGDAIVPLARNYFTGRQNSFTQLQRIAIGLVISIFAMLAAGTLEMVRLREIRRNNYYELKHVRISVFWQVPQYFIIGDLYCSERG